jgi:hypothetical protein
MATAGIVARLRPHSSNGCCTTVVDPFSINVQRRRRRGCPRSASAGRAASSCRPKDRRPAWPCRIS